MAKQDEIDYVQNMSKVLAVGTAEVRRALVNKPWNDERAFRYFLDFGQILQLLPRCPARVLDLGVGPGWTSLFLARCGYTVLGLDIAPDMVRIAAENAQGLPVTFRCHDYEADLPESGFDAVLIYDALHHASDEEAVIRNAHKALRRGGVLITAEPGAGHSKQPGSLDAVRRFGTTEKDMDFQRQLPFMRRAGFVEVHQYLRLSELPLVSVEADKAAQQLRQCSGLATHTVERGLTSMVKAIK